MRYPQGLGRNSPACRKATPQGCLIWHDSSVVRGNLWDDLTLGSARRRRRMHRQLRELDRWYAQQEERRRVGTDAWRRIFVAAATSVVAVVATLVLLHQQGIVVTLDGVGRRA